jgi:hypothetical protein
MDATTLASTAAALLLRPVRSRSRAEAGAARELHRLLEPELLPVVMRWASDGPDTEQLLCLVDILRQRAERDRAFAADLARCVDADAGASLAALRALSRWFAAADYEQGQHWCTTVRRTLEQARADADQRGVPVQQHRHGCTTPSAGTV